MPSIFDRAVDVTLDSLDLALVPIVATILSFSKIARALEAGGGGGMTFPFPAGLPTLWTYVSLPNGAAGGVAGPIALISFFPLFVLGLLATSALEAGFLGSLSRRIDDEPIDPIESARRFTLRIVGVNLLRVAIVVIVLPLMVLPPLAIIVVLVLSYLTYGLPFAFVSQDAGVRAALGQSVNHALAGGRYATFGFGHMVIGAIASFALTGLVLNGGLAGVLLGALVVAVPAVFVATYGLLLFRELSNEEATRDEDAPVPV